MRPLNGTIRSLVLLAGFAIAGYAAAFELPNWQSGTAGDHPLVGIVVDANGEETSSGEMIAEMSSADYVLLGEIHDNADHHTIQAEVIGALVAVGKRPAIVLEMVPRSIQPKIDAFLNAAAPQAAAFGMAVEWERRGWPAWQTYQPIMEIALAHGLPVIGGNLDRAQVRSVAKDGLDVLSLEQQRDYAMTRQISDAGRFALEDALFDGHCGLMPRQHLAPMALAQKARDGSMAAAMVSARADGHSPVVLVAGGGHARRDFGVPTALDSLDPDARIVSLSLVEASDTETDARNYVDEGEAVFDYMLVTPRAERDDPCEGLAERMGIKRQ